MFSELFYEGFTLCIFTAFHLCLSASLVEHHLDPGEKEVYKTPTRVHTTMLRVHDLNFC